MNVETNFRRKMTEQPNITQEFSKAQEMAEKLAREQEKARSMLEEALRKAEQQKQRIVDFWENLQILIQMVRAYFNKEYANVPWKTIVFAVAAIIYFLNPFDVIPDMIPSLGFLDDATVIAFVVNSVKEELDKYRQFQNQSIRID